MTTLKWSSAYLTTEEVAALGLAACGSNVLISRKASLYNCPNIRIGNEVRIDDFCVISAGEGGITLGNHIHLAIGVLLMGSANISIDDFAGLSSRVSVYSSNDDYTGHSLTGPTIPNEFRNVKSLSVRIDRHVIVGTGSVILPGSHLREGCAIGALTLVNGEYEEFGIYAGTPAVFLRPRSKNLLNLEHALKAGNKPGDL